MPGDLGRVSVSRFMDQEGGASSVRRRPRSRPRPSLAYHFRDINPVSGGQKTAMERSGSSCRLGTLGIHDPAFPARCHHYNTRLGNDRGVHRLKVRRGSAEGCPGPHATTPRDGVTSPRDQTQKGHTAKQPTVKDS